jgi:hypothetical protein
MTPPSEPNSRGDDWAADLDQGPAGGSGQDWTVDLDQDWTPVAAALAPVRPSRWVGGGLVIALIVALVVIWGPPLDPRPNQPPVASVLGGHLAVPIALHLPAGAVATADGSYVGVQFPGGGVVLVTVPTQVVDPSGVRAALPNDPAAWLARHPAIFVTRVRATRVGGAPATQVDYRRARTDERESPFARLPLFCGWRREPDPSLAAAPPAGPDGSRTASRVCTQITALARVRATFVQLDGRTLLVEAVWSANQSSTTSGRMPRQLQRSYTALLAGLTPEATAGTR